VQGAVFVTAAQHFEGRCDLPASLWISPRAASTRTRHRSTCAQQEEVTVADVIDLTPKLLERTVDTLLVEQTVQQTVQKAFQRLRILNQAISQMREEGSTDADIADTLLYGAGELVD
jgi:hypothetical protein